MQVVGFVVCTKDSRPILTLRNTPSVIAEALHFNAEHKGVELVCWCVMPDHLHFLARVGREGGDLLKFLHGFKTWTGRVLPEQGIPGPIWQRSFWDRHVRQNESLDKLVAYIVRNPVEEGLCRDWWQWPHMWLERSPENYGLWPGVT